MASAQNLLTKSGRRAPKTGLYLAVNHSHEGMRPEISVQAGGRLPICWECSEEIDWDYVGKYDEEEFDKEKLTTRAPKSTDALFA